jgi:hypothetical protein
MNAKAEHCLPQRSLPLEYDTFELGGHLSLRDKTTKTTLRTKLTRLFKTLYMQPKRQKIEGRKCCFFDF